ncbi:Os05g0584400 [Oryza sativa Japonica Group]|uniref:Os05g0584400 protein n=2 Tax=Oryza sativa subsp. japonica TaxID=39947 RepID=Q0DFK8_ORYSJ|nr:Os05g0584400 [Oryza sativa Japonica Group]BAS95556.1 Os05g0584400 [Oryza sativa Japonica Group]|eukprot:NP_001056451.1 Os05g0584400 [Oryza sativa Japonica Group]
MHIFRLLAARRRAVSTITAAAAAAPAASSDAGRDSEDEGPFFDLDFSSVRGASSSGSMSGSDDSDDDCTDLDFIISLHRSRSASPSYDTLFFAAAASEPSTKASFQPSHHFCAKRRGGGGLRTLSFGAKKAAFYGGRHSFARSSCSARSLRLFMDLCTERPCQSATRRCHGQEVTQENAKLIRVAISLLLILMVTKTNERPITSLNEIVVNGRSFHLNFRKDGEEFKALVQIIEV